MLNASSPPAVRDLKDHVADLLLNWDYRHLELEFRIGLKTLTFMPSVGKGRFERVLSSLGPAVHTGSTHELYPAADGVLRREKSGDSVTWVHKKRLANFDLRLDTAPWHVRASTSFERSEDHPKPSHPPNFVRRRERWSCRRGAWCIDLTATTGNAPDTVDNDEASYEVEVELADHDEFFRTPLEEIIAQGLRIVADLTLALGAD